MGTPWDPTLPGVLRLPSGRLVRGRALYKPVPAGPAPEFALYLKHGRPLPTEWEQRWVRWRDLRLPDDFHDAAAAFREAWLRAQHERVEVACLAGRGRTGTALACIAILDGVPRAEAVEYVRERYRPGAVETPWQRRFVRSFPQPSTLR
ncbi:protein phosphatase [Arthrobacter sp. CAU 1506]|uniref:protein-tyrosine phosphatase family protein n=1 Tax=Arthrobacter sp. CAU 1506 TaxID=2560052 RepID=UPI0010AD544D|nr:protein-tyrosine phosphatase family protein [Arthrobacter sp. CAU 1506]TJY67624.1 protein phosphatase [Arthrobacter sp. CAU 1506]